MKRRLRRDEELVSSTRQLVNKAASSAEAAAAAATGVMISGRSHLRLRQSNSFCVVFKKTKIGVKR
jgi:hypothetical protein